MREKAEMLVAPEEKRGVGGCVWWGGSRQRGCSRKKQRSGARRSVCFSGAGKGVLRFILATCTTT